MEAWTDASNGHRLECIDAVDRWLYQPDGARALLRVESRAAVTADPQFVRRVDILNLLDSVEPPSRTKGAGEPVDDDDCSGVSVDTDGRSAAHRLDLECVGIRTSCELRSRYPYGEASSPSA